MFHVIRPSRGQKVIEEVMKGHEPEIWVSDLYSSQANHPAMKRLLLRAFVIHITKLK